MVGEKCEKFQLWWDFLSGGAGRRCHVSSSFAALCSGASGHCASTVTRRPGRRCRCVQQAELLLPAVVGTRTTKTLAAWQQTM